MTTTGHQASPLTIFVDGARGISVSGILDATTVGELNRTVLAFFELADAELDVLTLDLSAVSACDKAARTAFRHAQTVCTEQAVALRLVPSEAVRQAICPPN